MYNVDLGEMRREVGALLRQIRTEAGVRQADLARMLDRPQSYVSKYESAEKRLDIAELHHVCSALNVPLIDFVKRLQEGGQ